jgi:hypothetical protein
MNKQKIRLSFLLLGLLFAFTVKAVDLSQVGRSVKAFKTYMSYMNEPVSIDEIQFEFIMNFLSNDAEAFGEAHDAFKLNLEANKAKLKKFAKNVYFKEIKAINNAKNHANYSQAMKDAFTRYENLKEIDRIVFGSIGSSSTQVYWLQDGKRKYRFYAFGTTDSPNRVALVKQMLSDLSRIKTQRPVIFFNAIAFVNPDLKDKKVAPYFVCDLNNPHAKFLEQKLDKDGNVVLKNNQPEVDNIGVFGNYLAGKVRESGLQAYILKTADKTDKFSNKWTNSVAKKLFAKDEIGLIIDNGGSGFSVREVVNQNVNTEGKDLVEILKEKDWDQFKNQKDIVADFMKGPAEGYINPTLRQNKVKMVEVITLWVRKNRDRLGNIKKIRVVMLQTGQLRELFFNISADKVADQKDDRLESDVKVAPVAPKATEEYPKVPTRPVEKPVKAKSTDKKVSEEDLLTIYS